MELPVFGMIRAKLLRQIGKHAKRSRTDQRGLASALWMALNELGTELEITDLQKQGWGFPVTSRFVRKTEVSADAALP